MKQILFFALQEDLARMLEVVETAGALKYVRMDHYANEVFTSHSRGIDIPNLGRADSESAINCTSYLVADSNVPIKSRLILTSGGARRFCIDQQFNPDTVTFTPAGMWSERVVLHGRVATATDSRLSKELMDRFRRAIKKEFLKIKAFYVSPGARELLDRGYRLTIAAQSPPEFDLR